MKDINDRIEVFETKILNAVELIQKLKQENGILLKENIRLKEEINQLSKRVESHVPQNRGRESNKSIQDVSSINIEQIRNELEECIEEVDACIALIED